MSERTCRYFAVLLSPTQLDFSFAFLVKNVATRDMFNPIREGLLDSKTVFFYKLFSMELAACHRDSGTGDSILCETIPCYREKALRGRNQPAMGQ